MGLWLKQGVAVTVKIGPYIDDTDGKTAETALTIAQADIRLSKAFGAFAQKASTASVTHDEKGWYSCPMDTADVSTLGSLQLASHIAGALPVWHEYMVLPANAHDSIVSGSDYLQTDLVQWLGVAPLALSSQLVPAIESTLETRLSATRAGYLDNLSAGAVALASGVALTAAAIDAILDELMAGHTTDGTLGKTISDARSDIATALSTLTAIKGAGWTTETLKAIKDAVDAITLTAAAIADAIWDELKSGHTIAGSFGKYLDTEVSGVGGGTPATLAAAVWTYVRRTLTAKVAKL